MGTIYENCHTERQQNMGKAQEEGTVVKRVLMGRFGC
jgi:hypothetical protein